MITSVRHINPDLSIVPPGQSSGLLDMPEDQFERMCSGMQTLEEARPGMMVPKSQWKERSQRIKQRYHDDVSEIYSQGEIGSCTGMMEGQLLEISFRRRYGLQYRTGLSGLSGYKQIPGVTKDSGATIEQAMEIGLKGLLPTPTPENKAKFAHTHSVANWNEQLPPGYQTTAKLHRAVNYVTARGEDMICSGLINGLVGGVGRQGHAIPYVYLDYYKNDPICVFANSWDYSWGNDGFGADSWRTFRNLTVFFMLDVVTLDELQIPELSAVVSTSNSFNL